MKNIRSEKYKDIIIQKLQSISDYHLAIDKFLEAYLKRNHLDKELTIIMKESNEKISRTLNEIHKIQMQKGGIEEPSTPASEKPLEKPLNKRPKKTNLKVSIISEAPLPPPWNSNLLSEKNRKHKK